MKAIIILDQKHHEMKTATVNAASQQIPRGFPHRDDFLCAVTPELIDVVGKSLVTDPGGQIPQAKVLLSAADPQAVAQVKTHA